MMVAAEPTLSTAQATLPATPLVGFSFSPEAAAAYGEDPGQALATLLADLHPAVVRLPVYWEQVEPAPGVIDLSTVDQLLSVVAAYDATGVVPARVVLVVGARNLGFPELHVPSWVKLSGWSMAEVLRSPSYLDYLEATVRRYRGDPLLVAWQVENEPLDDVPPPGGPADDVPIGLLRWEVQLVHSLDPHHPILVTSYDNAALSLDQLQQSLLGGPISWLSGIHLVGHMRQVLGLGDITGLDAYVATPNTPLGKVDVAERTVWKEQELRYWAEQAAAQGKSLWVTEMQAAPWQGQPSFQPQDLLLSAAAYRGTGAAVILLWGVEYWLVNPTWLQEGMVAVGLMRQGGGGVETASPPTSAQL
jgi:hypothetical protein